MFILRRLLGCHGWGRSAKHPWALGGLGGVAGGSGSAGGKSRSGGEDSTQRVGRLEQELAKVR